MSFSYTLNSRYRKKQISKKIYKTRKEEEFDLANLFSRVDLSKKGDEELIDIIEKLRSQIIDLELKVNLQKLELKNYHKFSKNY